MRYIFAARRNEELKAKLGSTICNSKVRAVMTEMKSIAGAEAGFNINEVELA